MAQTPFVHAELIGAQSVSVQSQAELERAKVQSFVERANVKERLQVMGVTGLNASERVASMTGAEVHALAQRIDAMPAGGALSANDLLIVLLIALLVAIVI